MAFSFRRLLLLVNKALLFAALLIVVIFSLFWISPNSFEAFGSGYRNLYKDYGKWLSDSALEELAEGDTSEAISLLEKWEKYQPSDRFFGFKRKVALALAEVLHDAGSHQQIVEIMTPLYEGDDRDVVVFAAWAKAALNVDEQREIATAKVLEYWTRFPQSATLSELYLGHIYSWDDPEHARALVARHGYLEPTDRAGWEVFWAPDDKFSSKMRRPLEIDLADAGWRAVVDVPAGTKLIRIDPPSDEKLIIENFKVTARGNQATAIGAGGHKMKMVTLEDGILRTNGGDDPYIIIDVEDLTQSAGDQIDLIVTMDVTSVFSGWVKQRMEEL